jgi:Flp pilus assembly protein TadB
MWETMQTFAILMATMGVVVALIYHFSSWSVFLIISTLVILWCVVFAFLWRNRRQLNWENEPESE